MSYFKYLIKRSKKALLYRRIFLYPKVFRNLQDPVIDIGCGLGDFLEFYPKALGLDINEECIHFCKNKKMNAELFDGINLKFNDLTIGTVVLDNVLEHIEKPDLLLNEISRAVKPNGLFIVGVPGVKGYEIDDDHKIYYSEKDLIKKIENFNFEHQKTIFTPFRNNFLNLNLRQYCCYGVFLKKK